MWVLCRECLDRVVLLGEQHLRHVVTEYAAHYLTERNHQGLGNELIRARVVTPAANDNGHVHCRRRLGGLLKYYSKMPQSRVG